MRFIAQERGEWAGIPMPLDGHPLVVEPRYHKAKELMEIGKPPREEPNEPHVKLRNIFWSKRYRCDIFVFEEHGRVKKVPLPRISALDRIVSTISCSHAWGIEQEGRAVQLLGTLLKHHQFKAYMLTGSFMEESKASGLIYIFRRLRPTVVVRRDFKTDRCTILSCLCMHPIAYYSDSWAGGMCPTDDVIAHLTMMRGDEHLFWRRCNQHAPDQPEAGL